LSIHIRHVEIIVEIMSALSIIGDGVGAVLMALAVPVAILAVGIPVAFVISLLLRLVGLG
jgi:hypothetical protein